ncbi:bifunctional PIG-L family deacetylase/class I SAM-dependent methyltransferase [Arthrobacter crystallopoietes]|uniref:bifunctional PIG-L family deacetylase/class I SAM-dependent methyltransferase n=1 Tax=Crystallibacter crystallopoietes TaxID=37928 RepID=UPI001ABDB6E4|nr:bifunctional PIG-L family deacetylase/class I SAM-dependent methyltransferase [Arthrobacter crystallopoietes]QTG82516.1 bifunctional PIG-L family deacetylase/class I SAM-dependent methyltransferase [Arthrobacter crystallopoietes]
MVSFSHTDTGTPEQRWQEAGIAKLPALEPEAIPCRGGRLVLVAAHPDDESLGAAGLIQATLAAGADVVVLLCTAGEASHPQSPTHTPQDLARIRLQEFDAVMGGLASDAAHAADAIDSGDAADTADAGDPAGSGNLSWTFLDLPDGKISEHTAELDAGLAAALAGAENAVIAATYREDGHTDHEEVGLAAQRAASAQGAGLLEFPIWYWLWAAPEQSESWRSWRSLALPAPAAAAKARALAAHVSQTAPLSDAPGDEALLSPGFLQYFGRPAEIFRWTPARDTARPNGAGTAAKVFDLLYRRKSDPWAYLSSWYEQRKRAVTMASLPREHYGRALEAGCSIGVLTAEVADKCGQLTAVDASSVALERAKARLANRSNVELVRAELPDGWPADSRQGLDLVLVSEVGYFLRARELRALMRRSQEALNPGGHLLLCHWLHPIEGWELDGETVHAIAREVTSWEVVVVHRERDFLLEILECPGGTRD